MLHSPHRHWLIRPLAFLFVLSCGIGLHLWRQIATPPTYVHSWELATTTATATSLVIGSSVIVGATLLLLAMLLWSPPFVTRWLRVPGVRFLPTWLHRLLLLSAIPLLWIGATSALVWLDGLNQPVRAFSSYGAPTQLVPNYLGPGNVGAQCAICHNYDTGSTGFKSAFANNNRRWNAALALLDSDGDGFSNGEELHDPQGIYGGNPPTTYATDPVPGTTANYLSTPAYNTATTTNGGYRGYPAAPVVNNTVLQNGQTIVGSITVSTSISYAGLSKVEYIFKKLGAPVYTWTVNYPNFSDTNYANLHCLGSSGPATSCPQWDSRAVANDTYDVEIKAYDRLAGGARSHSLTRTNITINNPAPTEVYVATTGTDSGNCANAGNPCRTIQYAHDQAGMPPITIRVAAGTHTAPAVITKQVNLLGGFMTANWTTANPTANLTILDGQNSVRPLVLNGNSTSDSVVDGFVIRNGLAAGAATQPGYGGGLYVYGANNLTIRRVQFLNNRAANANQGYGGGAALYALSRPILEQVLFDGNQANTSGQGNGGGLWLCLGNSVATMTNVTMTNNIAGTTADSQGGGLFSVCEAVAIDGATISNNQAQQSSLGGLGGGLALTAGDAYTMSIANATITGNRGAQGGGIYNNVMPELQRVRLTANTAITGGALLIHYPNLNDALVYRTFHKVLFARNSASVGGAFAMIGRRDLRLTLWDATIADNGLGGAAAIYLNMDVPKPNQFTAPLTEIKMTGVLLSGNQHAIEAHSTYDDGGFGGIGYAVGVDQLVLDSAITTPFIGNGYVHQPFGGTARILYGSVRYVNAADSDYRLQAGSAGIDIQAGSTNDTDLNGAPRTDGHDDAGAFEHQFATRPTVRYVAPNGSDATACVDGDHPCATPARAHTLAQDGDEIRLAAGVYTYTMPIVGAPYMLFPCPYVLCVTKPLRIIGGYTTANWTTPNPPVNPSVLDGANTHGVVHLEHTTGSVLLQGFTIRNGAVFGGMTISGDNVSIQQMRFENNHSTNDGGGLRAQQSNIEILDSVFTGNEAMGRGGGLAVNGGAGFNYRIVRSTFTGNTAGDRGGGLFYEGTGVISQTLIYSNSALGAGGGGGITLGSNGSHPTLDQVRILHNAALQGGGLSVYMTGGALLRNTLLAHNRATNAAGDGGNAIWVFRSDKPIQLDHVTIADNTGAVANAVKIDHNTETDRPTTMRNTLISGSPIGIASDITVTNLTLTNVLIANDVTTPLQNFSGATPLRGAVSYVDGANNNYQQTLASTGVDAGAAIGIAYDLTGAVRPQGVADIGAYETTLAPPTATPTPTPTATTPGSPTVTPTATTPGSATATPTPTATATTPANGAATPTATTVPGTTPTASPTATATATQTPPAPAESGYASGTIFADLNGDGVRNADEPGIAGVTIVVKQGDRVVGETVTDERGNYRVALAPGDYTVTITPPLGALMTSTQDLQVTVTLSETSTVTPVGLRFRLLLPVVVRG